MNGDNGFRDPYGKLIELTEKMVEAQVKQVALLEHHAELLERHGELTKAVASAAVKELKDHTSLEVSQSERWWKLFAVAAGFLGTVIAAGVVYALNQMAHQ